MPITTIILIFLALALVGAFGTRGYGVTYGGGYGAHSAIGLLIAIVLIVMLFQYL